MAGREGLWGRDAAGGDVRAFGCEGVLKLCT